jgi:hypothetical protein
MPIDPDTPGFVPPDTEDPWDPETPGPPPTAVRTFVGYRDRDLANGNHQRCEKWKEVDGSISYGPCVETPIIESTPEPPPAPTTDTDTDTDEDEDKKPEPKHEITYKELKDASGKVIGYEMYVDGVLQQTFDYSDMFEALDTIEKPRTFEEFMSSMGGQYRDVNDSEAYRGLSELVALMEDPETTAQDIQMASQQMATRLGYGSLDEMLADVEGMRTSLGEGIGAQQGLSEAEKNAFERATRATTQNQQVNARRMLDQVLSGATGNSTRNALMQANEYITQIRDTEIQASSNLALMDMQRKKEEFDSQMTLYKDMMDRGQINQEQVLDALYRNRMAAMEGYAQQINAITTQNEQYLRMYDQDLQRIKQAADQVYASIEAELNINADMREAMAEAFNRYWATVMTPYELDLLKQQIKAGKVEAAMSIISGILKGLALTVGLII